ncbi:MAG: hypothetical protein LBC72_03520 [Spirochaetaceae bacterium]|nr:hypothetical protein [Spirochaetaceae bacterium]
MKRILQGVFFCCILIFAACNVEYYNGFSLSARKQQPAAPEPPAGGPLGTFELNNPISPPEDDEGDTPRAIAWGETQRRWLLVSSGGALYSSDNDGGVWDRVPDVDLGHNAMLQYGGGAWVCGNDSDSTAVRLHYSTDGVTWTQLGDYMGTSFAYSKERGMWLVLVKWPAAALTSTDGQAWTISNDSLGYTSYFGKGICYGGGKWLFNYASDGYYASEDDGATWAKIVGYNDFTLFDKLLFRNGVWLGFTLYFPSVYYLEAADFSVTFADWTRVSDGEFLGNGIGVRDIAFNANRFVAVGENGKISWSADGKIWTAADAPFDDSDTVTAIGYGNGRWIAVTNTWKTASVLDAEP